MLRAGDGPAGVREVGAEIRKIAAIGGKRVALRTALSRQHIEIERDQALVGMACRSRRSLSHGVSPSVILEEFAGGIETLISRG